MANLQDLIDADIKNVFMNANDFADPFLWSRTGLNVNAIFNNSFIVIVEDVETTSPAIEIADEDITGLKHGDTFTRIKTGIVYTVVGIQPDGTGLTDVILKS